MPFAARLLLPLVGAMRNRAEFHALGGRVVLLPLVGAMRNPRPRAARR